ncbi:DUF397 domain-containing protein [Actinomadura fibrosa]|uniref:DUF397 domain-containing protein n=1 Tax=Actinomadura fibrosa TaxID=111802 RepID=A0ABW2XSK3_9ACTN
MRWQKSTRCDAKESCVEVAVSEASVLLRDSTRPDTVLRLSRGGWSRFLRSHRAERSS